MSSRIRSYGIVVIATGLAWLVDVLLQERFAESSGGLYVAAALVGTWFGGIGAGFLAIGLTIALNLVFFDHPELSMAVGAHGFERLILFTAVALVVSGLAAWVRRNQRQMRDLNAELEEKVRKRTAALNESTQQLEAFCYTLAHDLRAPLRAIQGFADLLIRDHQAELSPQAKVGAERIRNSAERMGRLILDLLAYTDVSRTDFQKQVVNVEAVSLGILRMFSDEIARTHAEVSLSFPQKHVMGDRVGVERVLVNLVANALKFADPKRRLRVQIASERRPPNLRISVEDNGIGMDPRYGERIFGVFERLTTGGNLVGTGIGLAIVKRSVEKMGGAVGVESAPGRGSCFWFELSEAVPKESAPAVRELAQPERV